MGYELCEFTSNSSGRACVFSIAHGGRVVDVTERAFACPECDAVIVGALSTFCHVMKEHWGESPYTSEVVVP